MVLTENSWKIASAISHVRLVGITTSLLMRMIVSLVQMVDRLPMKMPIGIPVHVHLLRHGMIFLSQTVFTMKAMDMNIVNCAKKILAGAGSKKRDVKLMLTVSTIAECAQFMKIHPRNSVENDIKHNQISIIVLKTLMDILSVVNAKILNVCPSFSLKNSVM